MAEEINKNEDQNYEDLKKVTDAAQSKQTRHRVDEYIAMVIALGAVFILWILQLAGLY